MRVYSGRDRISMFVVFGLHLLWAESIRMFTYTYVFCRWLESIQQLVCTSCSVEASTGRHTHAKRAKHLNLARMSSAARAPSWSMPAGAVVFARCTHCRAPSTRTARSLSIIPTTFRARIRVKNDTASAENHPKQDEGLNLSGFES